MGLSVGVGLTNACDLACAHCYRDTGRVDQLSLADVMSVCDALPVGSMNLGTGENGLHPDYAAIVAALAARGVRLSVTSNGFTLERSRDDTLQKFREVEVSIDCCIAPWITEHYEGIILGNLFERTLAEIWWRDRYVGFREALQTATPPESCRGCGVTWSL